MALLVTLISFGFAPSAEAASRNKFLIASDLHFNPMFDPALVAELAAADPTRWETILQRTTPDRFSLYGQDTNWWLLQSALDQMRKTLPHPAFIMVNGDLLAHRFPSTYRDATHDEDREHYRAFVRKTVEFLALELRKRFPDTKILLTPGNNDENCGDYSIRAGGIFLSDTAQLVRDLAGADEAFADSWKALGSYNVPHPTIPNFRILSLNTIFFSNNYHAANFNDACATVPSTAASDLLAWLEANLTQARLARQKTWLMFHIAPGIDGFATIQNRATRSEATSPSAAESCAKTIVPMWVPEWTARFDGLLETFHDTVVASFAGHTHSDDFRLINSCRRQSGVRHHHSGDLAHLRPESQFSRRPVRRRRFARRSVHLLSDEPQAGQQPGPRTMEEGVQLFARMAKPAAGPGQPGNGLQRGPRHSKGSRPVVEAV